VSRSTSWVSTLPADRFTKSGDTNTEDAKSAEELAALRVFRVSRGPAAENYLNIPDSAFSNTGQAR
jgi:hypothetical protein